MEFRIGEFNIKLHYYRLQVAEMLYAYVKRKNKHFVRVLCRLE